VAGYVYLKSSSYSREIDLVALVTGKPRCYTRGTSMGGWL